MSDDTRSQQGRDAAPYGAATVRVSSSPKSTRTGDGTAAGCDRRTLLRRLGQAGLVLGGSSLAAAIPVRTVPPDPTRPEAVVAFGRGPAELTRAAVERVGGMGRFVQRGETVLVKPNMAWDRTPEQGANSNPEVLAEVVRLCREAGAGRVVVAEVPVHDAARTAVRSGIEKAARDAGAEFVVPPRSGFTTAAIHGAVLDRWEVFDPALEADRVINVPVVKDHALSRLTCGLKNLYGFLGANRGNLHQRIHEAIADLALAFHPTLTVVDATRVMMRGGPQGGRLDDVRQVGAVGAGTDMVALDAWGATLLGADPHDIGHLMLAQGLGLGSLDVTSIEEIHVGT